jgi:autotransporter-associated beta strand protein
MSYRAFIKLAVLIAAIVLFDSGSVAHADTFYWDGVTVASPGGWNTNTAWSSSELGGADPDGTPGALDMVQFNIIGANSNSNCFLNATQSVHGILVTTTATLNLRGGGVADQTLEIGAGGVQTLAGSLSSGSATLNQNVLLSLAADQSWINDGGSFTIDGGLTIPSALTSTTRTLTLSGIGTGGNIRLNDGAISDGAGAGNVLKLVKSGSGTWTIAGTNTFTGGVTLSEGKLNINAAQAIGTGALTITGGTLDNTSGGAVTLSNNNAHIWEGNFSYTSTRGLNLGTGSVTMSTSDIEITMPGSTSSSNALTVAGVISDGGNDRSITKRGQARLILLGQNTFTGGVTITDGTVAVATTLAGSAVSSTGSPGMITSGPLGTGTLTFSSDTANGANFVTSSATTDTNTIANDIVFNLPTGAGFGNSIGNNGVSTLTGLISGAGGFTKGSDGTLVLSNSNNTYTGKTIVGRGVIQVDSLKNEGVVSDLGAPTAADAVIGIGGATNTATLRYSGTGDTTDRPIDLVSTTGTGVGIEQAGTGLIKFTSNVGSSTATAKTFTLSGSTAGTGEIAGIISDNSVATQTSLAKTGTGTWTLSGANTYTGTTAVDGGTLLVTNTHNTGGAYTVAAAGTLGGNGTISADVTLNGTISPGTSPGTLTIGSLTVNDNASGVFDLDPVNDDSTSDDLLVVTGAVNFSATTLNLTFTSAAFGGGAFSTPGSWLLIDGGSLTGVAPTSINYNFVEGLSGVAASLDVDAINGDISLVLFSVVPGDFDSNGTVDGDDFAAWQMNFPTASNATQAMGDGDGDGDVDGADFGVWQTK